MVTTNNPAHTVPAVSVEDTLAAHRFGIDQRPSSAPPVPQVMVRAAVASNVHRTVLLAAAVPDRRAGTHLTEGSPFETLAGRRHAPSDSGPNLPGGVVIRRM